MKAASFAESQRQTTRVPRPATQRLASHFLPALRTPLKPEAVPGANLPEMHHLAIEVWVGPRLHGLHALHLDNRRAAATEEV